MLGEDEDQKGIQDLTDLINDDSGVDTESLSGASSKEPSENSNKEKQPEQPKPLPSDDLSGDIVISNEPKPLSALHYSKSPEQPTSFDDYDAEMRREQQAKSRDEEEELKKKNILKRTAVGFQKFGNKVKNDLAPAVKNAVSDGIKATPGAAWNIAKKTPGAIAKGASLIATGWNKLGEMGRMGYFIKFGIFLALAVGLGFTAGLVFGPVGILAVPLLAKAFSVAALICAVPTIYFGYKTFFSDSEEEQRKQSEIKTIKKSNENNNEISKEIGKTKGQVDLLIKDINTILTIMEIPELNEIKRPYQSKNVDQELNEAKEKAIETKIELEKHQNNLEKFKNPLTIAIANSQTTDYASLNTIVLQSYRTCGSDLLNLVNAIKKSEEKSKDKPLTKKLSDISDRIYTDAIKKACKMQAAQQAPNDSPVAASDSSVVAPQILVDQKASNGYHTRTIDQGRVIANKKKLGKYE